MAPRGRGSRKVYARFTEAADIKETIGPAEDSPKRYVLGSKYGIWYAYDL
jgi:hypothetical protein